ncbi:hypothetical protein SapgrDRAFT_1852 [Saprospira grandis DSM 2844]|uniref:Uncharacterized protein n=1 Tax=Saprospira grandis DSM 2844 TaxID=694433 RepID=J0P7P9_9BACT|nr:hypothetical protein SapgrDRAFT_1852 [Saprospira grandis DSM 2844]
MYSLFSFCFFGALLLSVVELRSKDLVVAAKLRRLLPSVVELRPKGLVVAS